LKIGFFSKLFGGSPRWYDSIDEKIETYNTISKHFYDRLNFIHYCKVLMADVVDCYTEEEPDHEQEKVLIRKMEDFFQSGKREIVEEGTDPVPEFIQSDYSNMLQQYAQALIYLEKFIKQRKWAQSTELSNYFQASSELFNDMLHGKMTEDEYSYALDSLEAPKSPLEETGEDLLDVLRKINEYEESLAQAGEQILKQLDD